MFFWASLLPLSKTVIIVRKIFKMFSIHRLGIIGFASAFAISVATYVLHEATATLLEIEVEEEVLEILEGIQNDQVEG